MPVPGLCEHGSIRILFAGGCHVVGYPIGEQSSFPEIVRERFCQRHVPVEPHRLAYIKLSHSAKVRAACGEFQPDLLVLQLGHFELSRPLSQYLRSRLRPGRVRSGKSRAEAAAKPIRHTRLFRAIAGVKRAIDWVLGHPLVDFAQFEKQVDECLRNTKHLAPSGVILLSPLPCADSLSMYYRRRAAPIMQRLAQLHGIQYVDLVSLSLAWSFGASGSYYDAMHLGQDGQLRVGVAVADQILASLPLPSREVIPQ